MAAGGSDWRVWEHSSSLVQIHDDGMCLLCTFVDFCCLFPLHSVPQPHSSPNSLPHLVDSGQQTPLLANSIWGLIKAGNVFVAIALHGYTIVFSPLRLMNQNLDITVV